MAAAILRTSRAAAGGSTRPSRAAVSAAGCSASRRGGASGKLGVVKGLYIVAGVTMAGVSAVFVLLAELEDRYGLTKAGLGLIAGSAFAAALVTQLGLARYADRGYGLLLLRVGVIMAAVGLLWFAAGTSAVAVRRRPRRARSECRADRARGSPGDRVGVPWEPR